MDQDWITIPESLLSEAARHLDPRPVERGSSPCQGKDIDADVSRALVEALADHLREEAFCDHSVGTCALIGVVNELRAFGA